MARSGGRKHSGPRKSAIAKAYLRKASSRQQNSTEQASLSEVLLSRSKVDFLDPLMRHAAHQAKGIGLCAFLVTLAAFQRGLKVTFHYERASFDPRFARAIMQGTRGELFSISSGSRTHVFSRTLGDLTDSVANAIAEDKQWTKMALQRVGVVTPDGIIADKAHSAIVEKFLSKRPGRRFVVKPTNSTLARGVEANIAAEAVLSSMQKHAEKVIVEEYIEGTEYRATVVGGRCVAVSKRLSPIITGDGVSNIRQLIETFNEPAESCPFWSGASDLDIIEPFLKRQGLGIDSIPPAGSKVQLSNTSYGVQHVDVTDKVDNQVKLAATVAVRAIGLINAGVDIIVTPSGKPVVLELNQRSYIGFHSFPMDGAGQGNAVAEAIVDYYFPETIQHRTHPRLAYDFAAIHTALNSGQFSELTLPQIGPDWCNIRFSERGAAAKTIARHFETVARAAGVFVMTAPLPNGGVELCLACAPANWHILLRLLPHDFRVRLQKHAG